jgi:hypothetical protein
MICPHFLDPESRRDLIELARDGSAAHRLARRANALVLLDDGMSCAAIAKVLFLDDGTIRTAHAAAHIRGHLSTSPVELIYAPGRPDFWPVQPAIRSCR